MGKREFHPGHYLSRKDIFRLQTGLLFFTLMKTSHEFAFPFAQFMI